jgi:type II secretory pathway pseudopilin PulG
MPPAVAIAGVTAAATIGGAVLSSKAQKKAAGQAADTSAAATAANNALARDIYGQNAARLDPYAAGGMRAGNMLQGALGLGGGGAAPAGYPTTGGGALSGVANPQTAWTEGALGAMLAVTGPKRSAKAAAIADPAARLRYLQSVAHPDERAAFQAYQAQNPMPTATAPAPATGTPATGTPAAGQTPAQGALEAFNAFKNSGNYQFLFDEGSKAVQMSALPGGGFDSGATRKALQNYGQNTAASFYGGWMDRLAQQQQLGLGAASALAGVGQNFVSNVTANNNSAASAAANAALMQGNARANMWGGIAGGIGQAIGALGTSYGR